ncbi:N-acetylmuramoyl-L-alanine amidase [Macrococcus sp. DPC7161]|uniref:N-acetylmuramoyl-L-alanine amidase n=1 Tax=Macrococcus sp. DPC7161 TaxID=2507060 RepID=UPI00100B13C7|nr:N-acetylmuramoyl-L-alanine amidase [Macrococcus sp. DPC7161]RXK19104.1 LysM peptidoglycan-binding domain-containing protein [Macrococcus sp. DPC7161]
MKIMLVCGHGYNDPGAVSGKYNERDFIREHVVDTVAKYLKLAGHKVATYGKGQDMYQDSDYGYGRVDQYNYGIFWVKNQGYDVCVEFHLDASNNKEVDGGHVIIGAGLEPDNIDIGIQKAIEKHVDDLHGISKRDDLFHPRIAKEIGLNYRLVELGFITNKGDIDYILKHGDAFCKDIADAINGKEIVIKKKVKKAPKKEVKKPVAKKPSKKVSSIKYTHRVKKGDSLWLIATNNKLTVDQLKKLNGLKDNLIYEGQVLKLKK